MTNLREKYAEQIKEMIKDAKANVAEAATKEEQRKKELEEAQVQLDNLNKTVNCAQKQFAENGKYLRRLGRAKEPNPNEVEAISEPLHTYAKAARQIPGAKEKLEQAKDNLFVAKQHKYTEEDDLRKISFFS